MPIESLVLGEVFCFFLLGGGGGCAVNLFLNYGSGDFSNL